MAPPSTRHAFGAYVIAITPMRDGTALGVALGDGTVRLVAPSAPETPRMIAVHDGACLALVQDLAPGALLSGGDDGALMRIAGEEAPRPVGRWPGRWIEAVAVAERQRLYAVGLGRAVVLLDPEGAERAVLDHAATVGGAAFDPSGQRLAVAHNGGCTLWVAEKKGWRSTFLPWKGAHLRAAWSPNGRFIVTTMQEPALHGWRLADKRELRMRGYPAKVGSISWAQRGRWLATSGAERAVLWPFRSDDGPMGKEPHMLGRGASLVTRVAGHPAEPLLAIGSKDGAVELARLEDGATVALRDADADPVSALAWTPDGGALAVGTEGGAFALLALGRKAG